MTTDAVGHGTRRFVIWDGAVWWRTYTVGGFDGYRTLTGRRLPCGTLETALRRPDMAEEIRRLSFPFEGAS
jgi:hypothetical protein